MRPFQAIVAIAATGAAALSLAACSHTKDARIVERESGTLESSATADEPEKAAEAAVDRAADYCEKKKQTAVFPDAEDLSGGKQASTSKKILNKIPGVKDVFGTPEGTRVTVAFRCR